MGWQRGFVESYCVLMAISLAIAGPTVGEPDTEPPVAVVGEDMVVDLNDTVTFDGSASSDNVGIVDWDWRFEWRDKGEGATRWGETVELKFTVAGDWTVTLRVTDAAGLFDEARINVTVLGPEPPYAKAGPDIEVAQGDPVTLDGSASTDDVGIVSWVWTFEHGGSPVTLLGETVRFTFDQLGEYFILLNVTDGDGFHDLDVLYVTVLPGDDRPIARAGPDVTVEAGDVHTFDGTGSLSPVGIETYTWTFRYGGENVTLTGPTPEYTLVTPGEYNVTLRVTDIYLSMGTDFTIITVVDTTPPLVMLKALADVPVGGMMVVSADGSWDAVGIVNWTWRVAHDGEVLTVHDPEEVEFDILTPGVYTVNLTARDAAGNGGHASIDFDIPDEDGDGGGGVNIAVAAGIIIAVVVAAFVVALLVLVGRTPPGDAR